MKFLKKNLKVIIFILVILILCVIKQMIVRNLPILANARAVEDDQLMVSHAVNITKGEYLGDYTYNTLIKNNFFPMFLAFSKKLGISYINMVTLLYSLACIIFIIAIKKNVKNKIWLLVIFSLLLFNPIMFSEQVFQRVYRNSIIPALSLMIIGCYIGMFLYKEDKLWKNVLFSIICAIALAGFYYTREDSMWIIPFVVFITICTIVFLIINLVKNKEKNKKTYIIFVVKIFLIFLPVIVTSLFGKYFSYMNYKYYGTKEICSQKQHAKLTNTLYEIKPNQEIPLVSNTREKIERIAEVSPSFAKIKPELDKLMESFKNKDGEVINGLFGWPLVTAIYNSGYDTPEKEKEIIDKISSELNEAMDNGLLERQKTMPILGGELLNQEGYKKWFDTIIKAFIFIGDYENIMPANMQISIFWQGLDEKMDGFKYITGNRVLFEDGAKDINGNFLLELADQEEYIKSIEPTLNILNNIQKAYVPVANIVQLFGVLAYIVITIYVIINIITCKGLKEWICVSGIIGAIFTLIVGVSYVEVTQTKAVVALYLSACYPLFIAFSLICMYNVGNLILDKIKRKGE